MALDLLVVMAMRWLWLVPSSSYLAVKWMGNSWMIFGHLTWTPICVGPLLFEVFLLDISAVQLNPIWESYEPGPRYEKPPRWTNPGLVAHGNHIIMFVTLFPSSSSFFTLLCRFSSMDGLYHYNDTWLFELSTWKWTELQCTGYIPYPCEGHTIALVNDVIYVFGGHGIDRCNLSDLIAFKLSSK